MRLNSQAKPVGLLVVFSSFVWLFPATPALAQEALPAPAVAPQTIELANPSMSLEAPSIDPFAAVPALPTDGGAGSEGPVSDAPGGALDAADAAAVRAEDVVAEVVAAETTVPSALESTDQIARDAAYRALEFLREGGPSIWAIAALAVVTVALILWKVWRLALLGAWSRGKAFRSVALFEEGNASAAVSVVAGRRGVRSKVTATTILALESRSEADAREETGRVAKQLIANARSGLGALELIATIAPLLGLLGTVLGMIAAFQALQEAGSNADPSLLAGGIWEALLTTAAGMAVAIPASAALTWFEAIIERIRLDMEDCATRLFLTKQPEPIALAAE